MSPNRVTKRNVLAARNNITVNEERENKVVTTECRETVLATPRRNLRRNYQRNKTQEKNFNNIRRSSRKRKLKYENYSDSWIVGAQALIGYPMYGNSYSMKEGKNNYDGDEEEETFDDEEEELEENRNEVEGNEVVSDKQAEEVNEQIDDEQVNGDDCADNSEKPVENGVVEEPSKEEGSRSQRLRRACRDKITPNTTNGRPRRGRNGAANSNAKTRKQKRKRRGNGNTSSSESNYEAPVAANSGVTYCLRKTRGQVDRFNVAGPLSSRRRRHRSVTESETSADSEDEAVDKARRGKRKSILHNVGTEKFGRLGDLDPVSLDTDIKFTEVGGLEEHVQCLKEMVIFPMKYSELFTRFHITLPKGVLFHGPPGTGKTLLARALANECSSGQQKVAFFMRKGADVMSKWVGESERQLRLLFEQARQSRPSIIFFDEIDGLAPVRSTKQDQVHASIVSTLLALMDGLDNRGDIIVIGATNRIDAIDPALRRPGRFDRELLFPLPSSQQRGEILKIHTGKWESQPSEADILKMAELSNGYCGADLRGLCAEAVMAALRRRYPQIYKTNDTLLINPDNVKVEWGDFAEASKKLVPSTHRSTPAVAQRLPLFLEPLFKHTLSELNAHLRAAFPSGYCKQQNACKQMVKAPRLLLIGQNKEATLLASALLCNMESCPVHVFDVTTMYTRGGISPEEACVMIFNEARRTVPSVIYMPCVDNWWDTLASTLQALIILTLNTIDPCLPILLMATTQTTVTSQLERIFSSYRKEIYRVPYPTDAQRKQFFQPLIIARSLRPIPKNKSVEEELEELPRAPTPPPPKRTADELRKIIRQEDTILRDLRYALRIICEKIAREKTFFLFVKPVDEHIVTDYRKHVHQPMYIEKVMLKINNHEYSCLSDFVEDMKLIVDNALRYNPDKTEEGKAIRHRACMLHDKYHQLITEHVSLEMEMACKKVVKDRLLRERYPDHLPHDFDLQKAIQPIPGATLLEEDNNSTLPLSENEEPVNKLLNKTADSVLNSSTSRASQRKRRRKSAWQHGRIKKQATNKINSQRHELNVNNHEKFKTDSNSTGKAESPSSASKSGFESKQSKVVLVRLPSPIRHSTPVRRRKRTAEPEVAVPSTSYAAMNGDVHSDDEMEIDGEPVTITKQLQKNNDKDDEDLWLDHSFNISTVDSLENNDETGACNKVVINRQALEQVLQEVVRVTRRKTSLELILDLYATLRCIINKHLGTNQRQALPAEMESEIKRFAVETQENNETSSQYPVTSIRNTRKNHTF
ncbi:ATPase family AAA domain-containing protein 2 [Nilaparvata lugens]|uniref:ATPase family AAA domain-containing protein 2 n=1 Tax=Nilaparvata lugens TaxID=108931 RepID=UPI00193E3B18|nr:ATPase family AAA domain-containing protein 2 [Nilaparvata lugens]